MPPEGVIWLLAALVGYSAVLYGGWPHNSKFGFKGDSSCEQNTSRPSSAVSSEIHNDARGGESWQQRLPGIYGVTYWRPVVATPRVPATLEATPPRFPVKWSLGGGFTRANMGTCGWMA